MSGVLPTVLCSVFVLLGAWHFYMAAMGSSGNLDRESAGVPSVNGKPLFVPSTASTITVGIVLMLFAGLVAATSGLLVIGLPGWLLAWLSYGLALGLFARAVGEFRYVGFFKKVRGSRFARLDTWVYSPLCVLLSAGVLAVAAGA